MKTMAHDDYELLDSGGGRKFERFGPYRLVRPAANAVWAPALPDEVWQNADASFDREDGNAWTLRKQLPQSWDVSIAGLKFKLSTTSFGHLGVFPEQRQGWNSIHRMVEEGLAAGRKSFSVLNLFAYTGGATLAAAKAGASVCHLDASRGMVARARENAQLNDLASAPVRWIVDDVTKFLEREHRRGSKYDAIILDPPSFGRGKAGEVFKIDLHVVETLERCIRVLAEKPAFILLSCHTQGYTPIVLNNLLSSVMKDRGGEVTAGEMLLTGGENVAVLPSGTYSIWRRRCVP